MIVPDTSLPETLHCIRIPSGEAQTRSRDSIPMDALPGALIAIERMLSRNTSIPMSFDGEDWLLAGQRKDRAFMLTLWKGTWDKRHLFLRAGTAPDAEAAKVLWPMLHKECETRCSGCPFTPPALVPWTVDHFLPTTVFYPQEASWLADFSAVLGWAWLTYLKQTEEHPVH